METPYLLRGMNPVATDSSELVSSSKYLNNARLREWFATIALKRNGPDMLPQAETYVLPELVGSLQDKDAIEEMITEERKVNPALDAWFKEWRLPKFTAEALKDYADGTLGHIFYRDVISKDYAVVIYELPDPKTQLEFFLYRSGQSHDFEHILCGGDFNYMGEIVPNYARISNVFKHFENKELAKEVNLISFLSVQRYVLRTMINYPDVWPTAQYAMQRGLRVGTESGPFFLAQHDDYLHLPLEEARAAMGIVGAEDVDTTVPSRRWSEADRWGR